MSVTSNTLGSAGAQETLSIQASQQGNDPTGRLPTLGKLPDASTMNQQGTRQPGNLPQSSPLSVGISPNGERPLFFPLQHPAVMSTGAPRPPLFPNMPPPSSGKSSLAGDRSHLQAVIFRGRPRHPHHQLLHFQQEIALIHQVMSSFQLVSLLEVNLLPVIHHPDLQIKIHLKPKGLPPNIRPQFFPPGLPPRSGFPGGPRHDILPGPPTHGMPPGRPPLGVPHGMSPGQPRPPALPTPPGPPVFPRLGMPPGMPPRHGGPLGGGRGSGGESHRQPGPPATSEVPPRPVGPPGELTRPPVFTRPPPPGDALIRLPGGPPGELTRPMQMSGTPRSDNPPGGNRPPGAIRLPDGPRHLMRGPFPIPQGVLPRPGGPLEVWFEHVTADGQVYYSHPQTKKTVWERPLNAQIHRPPLAGPRGGRPFPDPGSLGNVPPAPFPPGFPPQVPGHPQLMPTRVWSDHHTPDNRTYFYNKVTKQSVWEKPKDFELVMPLPVSFSTPPSNPLGMGRKIPELAVEKVGSGKEEEVGGVGGKSGKQDTEADSGGGDREEEHPKDPLPDGEPKSAPSDVPNSFPTQINSILQTFLPPPSTIMPLPISTIQLQPLMIQPPASFQLPPAPAPAKLEPKGPRPISSVPVQGTPWSVVWSSDDRRFFFNVTDRISVWSIPEELEGSESVRKILDNPPGGKKREGGGGAKGGIIPNPKRIKISNSDESDDDDGDDDDAMETGGVSVVVGDAQKQLKAAVVAASVGGDAQLKSSQVVKSNKTLEERQQDFKIMLLERGVSAFSTWEKELPKFVFDPRYMLLSVKERKACFEAFIRSRTEEERREKKNKLKEMRDRFNSLLEEAKLHPKSSFSEFASKYSKDERFKSVEKMREREQMFTDFLGELKKAVSRQKDEHKTSKSKVDKLKVDFLDMFREGGEVIITEKSQWKKVKGSFNHDPRYKAIEGSSRREELFKEYIKSLKDEVEEVDPEQERQDRIQASLMEREREVQMSRSAHEKEWGRERDQLRKMEAQQQFKAILVDIVKGPQAQWHSVKKSMRKDSRWEFTRLLDHEEKDQLFQEHVLGLANKKRLQFRKLLEETIQITLNMPWRKARKLIKEDVRYRNFTDSDHKREVEYDKYQMDKMITAKNDFRSLLKETKIINYRSHDLIKESGRHYKDVIDVLKNDKRHLVLECVSDEREDILYEYLENLHRKGPPPPPTATHPGERLKRVP